MQLQKQFVSARGQTERERQGERGESGSIRETQRREGGERLKRDVLAAVPVRVEVLVGKQEW